MEGNWDFEHLKLYEGDSFTLGGRTYRVVSVERDALVVIEPGEPATMARRVTIVGGRQRA